MDHLHELNRTVTPSPHEPMFAGVDLADPAAIPVGPGLARIAALEAERDALLTRVNNLESLACANPCCQLHQLD